jgi:hypothetical protein
MRNYRVPSDIEAYNICRGMAEGLGAVYPGYQWQVMMQQDLVYVQNLSLSTARGYKLPLSAFDIEGKTLIMIGGEILERFGCRRGRKDKAEVKALKRDLRGNATPEE